MKSLQRDLRDRFPPREAVRARIESPRPRRSRVRLSVFVVLLAVAVGALASVLARSLGARVVADARVEAFRQVVRAPADVRVVEVRCAPGARVRAGEVLAVLAPVAGQARRREAEVAVQRARARLAALEAGGRFPDLDLYERVESALEARREATSAGAELDVRTAEVLQLERERARAELESRLARADRGAAQDSFGARRQEATARLERARGEGELRALEVERLGSLAVDGLVSELALSERRTALQASLHTQAELSAALDAVESDQQAERESLERDSARGAAQLAALDAALAAARERRAGAAARTEQWQVLAQERERLAPIDEGALERLRARELELARIDVAAAQAALEAELEAGGGGELRAAFDGRIDTVAVVPGAELAAGEPLLAYHESSALGLVAYLRPQDARRLGPGVRCTLVPEDGGPALDARALEVAPRLVPCPAELGPEDREVADLRVEVRLECDAPELLERCPLDLRFKVVFSSPSRGPDAPDGP